MLTKKRLFALAGLATGLLLVALMVMIPPRPGVNKANFDRIKVGMSRSEVEEIFGGPALAHDEAPPPGVGVWETWEKNDSEFAGILIFDDVVEKTQWFGSNETTLERLLGWLGIKT